MTGSANATGNPTITLPRYFLHLRNGSVRKLE
jgi:hypothetical protein